MKRVLYISYDGMTDQLGQSQVIPYLIGLSKAGYSITIISFEKASNFNLKFDKISALLSQNNISWKPLPYTKKPPVLSTVFDLYRMKKLAMNLHNKMAFDIVHCRSYISAIVGLFMKRKFATKFIFDMRGFWANERVDGGLWNLNNPIYKRVYDYFKGKERAFMQEADYIISLTEAGKKEIAEIIKPAKPSPIKVIPCCVDTELFSEKNIYPTQKKELAKALNIADDDFIISYLGAIGTWYMIDEMLQFFVRLSAKMPNAKFLFITNEVPAKVLDIANKHGINSKKLIIKEASREEVPLYIEMSRLSLFFIKPSYSKKASSPTKLGEIMSMGKPVVCNGSIGDLDQQVTGFGAIITTFNDHEYDKIIDQIPQLLAIPPEKIRQQSINLFSLNKGIESYREVYAAILEKG